MDMMTRRRAMMAGIALPEWDYEWDYTDGLPENNDWVKATSGSGASSLQSSYVRMQTAGASSYITYRNPETFNMSRGVLEAVMAITLPSGATGYSRLCLGNGTKGIHILVHAPTKTIKLYDNGTIAQSTTIKSNIVSNTFYTIRLVLDGGYGDVFIDDEKVASHVDIKTILYSSNTSVWHQASITVNTYTRLKSIKMKIGRL